MSAHFQRALILFEQSRPDLAEQELRQALAADPNHAMAHALLAQCLADRKEYRQATDEVEQAIHLAPDLPYVHLALARVLQQRNHLPQAEAAIREALRLEPESPDFHAMLASILFGQERWADALTAADVGLQLDGEHVGSHNLRAMALVKLGRRQEAGQALETTLARDPENASSHANLGWTYLEQNDPRKALESFREALRLDPELGWAKAGMVEALKARYFIYRIMLAYFLWMAKLSGGARWGVIIGGYIGYRLLGNLARDNPELAPFLWPILGLYIAFAVMTWIASPLFNLLMRLNRYGKYALTRDQIVASNWVATCLLAALGFLVVYLATGVFVALLTALAAGLLVMPTAGTFGCSAGWPRLVMGSYTILLAVTYVGAFALALTSGNLDIFTTGLNFFFIGSFIAPWLANGLAQVEVKH